jgi:hypothetical protein
MDILNSYTPGANFWELFPTFGIAGACKKILDEDKSKGKKDSSTMMWFVAFCYEMANNRLYNLPIEEKHTLVGTDYAGNPLYYTQNKAILDELIEYYCQIQDTPADRQLRVWNLKMDEKTKFIQETAYGVETWKMIEDMIKGNKEMYANYQQIKDQLSKEEGMSKAKGNKIPSLSDSGVI